MSNNQFSLLRSIFDFSLILFTYSFTFFNFLGRNEKTIGHDVIFTFTTFGKIVFFVRRSVRPERHLNIVLFVEIQRYVSEFEAGYLCSQRRFCIFTFEANHNDFFTANREKIGCIYSSGILFFDGEMSNLNIFIIGTTETLGNIVGNETDSEAEIIFSNIFPSLE